MTEDTFIVRCTQCKAKNRIPRSRAGERASCGKCHAPLPFTAGFPEHPVPVTDRTFAGEVLSFPGPVVVTFWAPWCGYCRHLLPTVDQIAPHYAGSIKFVKVDMDKNPATASQYQVMSVPTILLFKGGRAVNRLVGDVPRDQLEYHFRALL